MFSSMYSHISVITPLVFFAINKGESTKLEDIEKLLAKSEGELPGLAQSIIDSEAEIKKLQDKIINEAVETGNNTVENYVNCWKEIYEIFYGIHLFDDAVNRLQRQSEEYDLYSEEHSLQQCLQEEADAYSDTNQTAKLQSIEGINCDDYRPSGKEQDLQELKKNIGDSYQHRMRYGKTILFMEIHETAIENLKEAEGRN
uniref:Uncharacterized protein n=1 Tax=Trichobilharzia regenti TaxID=157069 RepID=A0AA85KA95_TRIRE|nr:unnamed protein product [Trichobilharzia regenti]